MKKLWSSFSFMFFSAMLMLSSFSVSAEPVEWLSFDTDNGLILVLRESVIAPKVFVGASPEDIVSIGVDMPRFSTASLQHSYKTPDIRSTVAPLSAACERDAIRGFNIEVGWSYS